MAADLKMALRACFNSAMTLTPESRPLIPALNVAEGFEPAADFFLILFAIAS